MAIMSNNEERIIMLTELLRKKTNYVFAIKVRDCISRLENVHEIIIPQYRMPNIDSQYWFDYIVKQAREIQSFAINQPGKRFIPTDEAYAIAIIRYVREVRN